MNVTLEVYVRKSNGKKIFVFIMILLILWISVLAVDYYRVVNLYDKPMFALLSKETALKDGGSGSYYGLGYRYDIEGKFMTEDEELEGVTRATLFIFGNEIKNFTRE